MDGETSTFRIPLGGIVALLLAPLLPQEASAQDSGPVRMGHQCRPYYGIQVADFDREDAALERLSSTGSSNKYIYCPTTVVPADLASYDDLWVQYAWAKGSTSTIFTCYLYQYDDEQVLQASTSLTKTAGSTEGTDGMYSVSIDADTKYIAFFCLVPQEFELRWYRYGAYDS